jgi:hypothetical protein
VRPSRGSSMRVHAAAGARLNTALYVYRMVQESIFRAFGREGVGASGMEFCRTPTEHLVFGPNLIRTSPGAVPPTAVRVDMRLAVRARAVAACPRRVLGTGARGSWEPRHEAPTSVCNDTSFSSPLAYPLRLTSGESEVVKYSGW